LRYSLGTVAWIFGRRPKKLAGASNVPPATACTARGLKAGNKKLRPLQAQ
jgi:hypothetical protein